MTPDDPSIPGRINQTAIFQAFQASKRRGPELMHVVLQRWYISRYLKYILFGLFSRGALLNTLPTFSSTPPPPPPSSTTTTTTTTTTSTSSSPQVNCLNPIQFIILRLNSSVETWGNLQMAPLYDCLYLSRKE
ncbi:uncharacterized protein H6S33_011575 [Morchella sextelata]|uniref:uncharacterized protein n=1 Tax=Morchella sextelata TaxID=1174677 RepID=UPI001D03C8F6|nr:uncharacterized protein H6S33_011575 [Morchella sextelata]KAH0611148.1 hypothetical protein H6S33_011575 [Morchella sextelata]